MILINYDIPTPKIRTNQSYLCHSNFPVFRHQESHLYPMYPDQYTLLTKHHIRQILAIHQITTVTHSFLTKHGYYAIDQSNTRVFPRDIACCYKNRELYFRVCRSRFNLSRTTGLHRGMAMIY